MKEKKVGVIGLGIMGANMAANLLRAHFNVYVYNRSPGKEGQLVEQGAIRASTPAELALACDTIIIMVTDAQAVWDVCKGADGVFSQKGKDKTIIQMSTLDIESTLEISRMALSLGYDFLDCPVSGSKKQVEEGQLILEAGGDSAVLEGQVAILHAIGKKIVHAGAIGSGTALKLCINLLVAQMTTGICESVRLARACGLNPELIFDVIQASPALDCGYYRIKREPLIERDYAPAFALSNMLKDVRFMQKESVKRNIRLLVNTAVEEYMSSLVDEYGDQDLSVIVEYDKVSP
jgi:3-hydroxyisobutyrate dehydrogenase-like beta-hydroxyacid dehydrogenase